MPKVRVQQRGESEQCPLCLDRLTGDAQKFACDCGVRYHQACVEEMGGECVAGCRRKLRVHESSKNAFRKAWKSARNEQCPLCLFLLIGDAGSTACTCGVRYHRSCVEEMGGQCVPGCGRKLLAPRRRPVSEGHKRPAPTESVRPPSYLLTFRLASVLLVLLVLVLLFLVGVLDHGLFFLALPLVFILFLVVLAVSDTSD